MANDRAFLYCLECNAHELLFKTMADGWYARGPEFAHLVEGFLDEHKTCGWPWPAGSSAPPLHIRYECVEPKLPEGSRWAGEGRAQSPAPAAIANADVLTALGEQWIAEMSPEKRAVIDTFVQRLRAPAPAWTREAPKAGDGWYWVRISGEEPVAASFARGGWWTVEHPHGSYAPTDVEHYPVRLEPPK